MANIPSVGIGKQSQFGTKAATLTPFKATSVDPGISFNRIENDEMFGGIDQFAPINGTVESSFSASGRAYPGMIGHFLQMVSGAPVTTGSSDYTHVFAPKDTLPPRYTIGLKEDNGISTKIVDFMVSSFSLNQELGNVLTFDVDGIGTQRLVEAVAISGSPETGRAFQFDDFTAEIDSVANVNFKTLNITVSNPTSNIFTLNGNEYAAAQEFTGRRTVEVSGTMRFVNDGASLRSAFEGNTSMELVLAWTIDQDTSLEVVIPDFRISDHNWTRGFAETEVDFSGAGYTDGVDGAIKFTLKNQTATY